MATPLKIQVLETIAALITAAFGLLAALAWNEAIRWAVLEVLGTADAGLGYFIYAIIVTILAVVMCVLIARALGKAKASLVDKK
jgi:heme/copper-type cytochrome/quinol oxidase subunit 2